MEQEKTNTKTVNKTAPPSRRKVGYGPVSAVVVMVLTYVLSQVFAALIISSGAEIFGYDAEQVLLNLSESAFSQFIYIALVQAITLYVIWLFLKVRSVRWKEIGLGRLPKFRDLYLALGIFVIYFIALAIITALITTLLPGIDSEQKQQIGFENAVMPLELVLVFVSLVILPPVVEEIVVRGFLYTGLRARFTKVISALIASILFGIAHLQLGSGAPPLWIAAVDTAVLSLFLIYLRERTGALWSGMIVHGIKNGLAFFVLFVVKWV